MWFLRYLFRKDLSLIDAIVIGTVSTGVFTGGMTWWGGLIILVISSVVVAIMQDLLQV